MTSFEDINILITVKFFCLKNVFFLEKAFIWKINVFENKNVFEKKKSKKVLFETKKLIVKKQIFFGKLFFEKKILLDKNFFWKKLFFEKILKKNFFHLWCLSVRS